MAKIDEYKENKKFNDFKFRKEAPWTDYSVHYICIKDTKLKIKNKDSNFKVDLEVDDEFIAIVSEFGYFYIVSPGFEAFTDEQTELPKLIGKDIEVVVDDIE